MKKFVFLALCFVLILALVACGQAETPSVEPAVLQPLANEPLNTSDGIFNVRFDAASLTKTDSGYALDVEIFTYDLYDAVDVQMLETYGSIVVCGEPIAIDALNILPSGQIEINGGLESGICLMPNGGGTYRTVTYNDYPLYYSVGSVTLPISEDVQVFDLSRHDETVGMTDEAEYPAETVSGYAELEQTVTDETYWWEGATTVRTENGAIVNIKRIWTP